MTALAVLAGAAGAFAARAAFVKALEAKLRRDVAALSAGDPGPLLKGWADDGVLVFNDGDHRWAGTHRGKAAVARFLDQFVAAGLQGELSHLHIAGPPWAMTVMARFDDHSTTAEGEVLYRNRVAILLHTRRGKVVRQEDFYEDTGRIEAFDRLLTQRGVRAPERVGAGG